MLGAVAMVAVPFPTRAQTHLATMVYGWNDIYVQPEVNSYAGLRSKILVVDAPDTAFAFQLCQMLK